MRSALILSLMYLSSCYNCERSFDSLKDDAILCYIDTIYDNPENRYAPTVFSNCPDYKHKRLYLTKFEFPILYDLLK